ncbi:MAG: hypothetical protein EZS28_036763 [Streblomastix strix]|uniref:Uncharacterized protein n=1 Tax=Streblomastix strix TaxID=222440 RepID=A0A5J4UBZ3_9EUKA|nr:MAG: hypothetical protein EZS28_036763 [Streblomastix strix]
MMLVKDDLDRDEDDDDVELSAKDLGQFEQEHNKLVKYKSLWNDNVESVCKDGESKMSYLVSGTAQCLKGNALQIGGALDGICVCVIFLMMQIPFNLFLFENNYKHGGHFQTYSGSSSAIEYIILFGVVFAQRELVNWYFCRDCIRC